MNRKRFTQPHRRRWVNKTMKRIAYEACGIILAIAGAFLLVATYMPLINPSLVRIRAGRLDLPVIHYILWTVVSLALMALGKASSNLAKRTSNMNQKKETSDPTTGSRLS